MKKIVFSLILIITLLSHGYEKIHNIHRFYIYLSNGTSKSCVIKSGNYEWRSNGLLIKDFQCDTKSLKSSTKISVYKETKEMQKNGYYIFIHNNLIEGKFKRNNKQDLSFSLIMQ